MEKKQDVVSEIRRLQTLPDLPLSRGSSIPQEFFHDIAREFGLPLFSTMPQYARAIIEHVGLIWSPTFSSENSLSGGGSTVTYEGLCAIRDAYVLWMNLKDESDTLLEIWTPPSNWRQLRTFEVERQNVSQMKRQGASEFREIVSAAYKHECAITRCSTAKVNEVAHVVPYFGVESDVLQNAIVLRVDLHRAFDAGLFDLDYLSDGSLSVSWVHEMLKIDYPQLLGTEVNLPESNSDKLSINALEVRREFLNLSRN